MSLRDNQTISRQNSACVIAAPRQSSPRRDRQNGHPDCRCFPSRLSRYTLNARLVGELDLKPGEVDLGLLARRSLEARFKSGAAGRTNVAHAVAHYAVAASKAALLDLPEQTPDGQCGIGRQALAQYGSKRSTRLGAGGRFL